MNPKKIWANLSVEDLARTTKFYTDLGFKPNGKNDSKELTSFFFGEDKLIIHFFIKETFSANVKIEPFNLKPGSEIVFTLAASSRQEVDDWQEEVRSAGGEILSPAIEFGKGYYGFLFSDPDGHRFNVFYMEGF